MVTETLKSAHVPEFTEAEIDTAKSCSEPEEVSAALISIIRDASMEMCPDRFS